MKDKNVSIIHDYFSQIEKMRENVGSKCNEHNFIKKNNFCVFFARFYVKVLFWGSK